VKRISRVGVATESETVKINQGRVKGRSRRACMKQGRVSPPEIVGSEISDMGHGQRRKPSDPGCKRMFHTSEWRVGTEIGTVKTISGTRHGRKSSASMKTKQSVTTEMVVGSERLIWVMVRDAE
jgi:hypothetical protein